MNIEPINVVVDTDFAKSCTAISYSYDVMYVCVARNLKIKGTALSHEAAFEREHDNERDEETKEDETCTRGNLKSRP